MTEPVAVGRTVAEYNGEPPYHPDARFPEMPFGETSQGANHPYRLLRDLLWRLGFDAANWQSRGWNPLGHLIVPGQTVVIKPNFVLDTNGSGGDIFSVVTHPSLIRALVDYAYIALRGEGRIIIADAPQMDCCWEVLMAHQRLDTIQEFYRSRFGFDIEVYDLRNFALRDPSRPGLAGNRVALAGDPAGSVVVNLGRQSEFYGMPGENFYGADYDREETRRHHCGETQEYCLSKTILGSDVFLSVPKLKVHKKVGVTLNLKGLVGINTNKNYLVHYRVGTPSQGGDQLPEHRSASDQAIIRVQRMLFDKALAKQSPLGDLVYRAAAGVYRGMIKPWKGLSPATQLMDGGNWHGNDSAWRMTADLAKILFFADATGRLHKTPQRKIFCLVDGIVGGESNGPLSPDPKPAGCLVAGENPFAVDLVAARMMGFDPSRIKQFSILQAPRDISFGLNGVKDIEVRAESKQVCQMFDSRDPFLAFKPHPAWVGHLEV